MYDSAQPLLGGSYIPSNYAFSRTPRIQATGLRGAFAGGDNYALGRTLTYPDSYPYLTQHGYLSASSRSSASASPVALSPSPEPCLGYDPAAFSASSTSQNEQVYFDPRSTGADWSQPVDPIATFFYP